MNTQRAIREYQDNSPSWGEYYAEQLHRAERYVPTHKMEMDLPVPSAWQLIREEYRDNPAAFLVAGLIWMVVLGIGLVMLAIRQGWVS